MIRLPKIDPVRGPFIADIAHQTLKGKTRKVRMETFGFALRNFLDGFYRVNHSQKRKILRSAPPPKLREALADGGVADAYLAALANHLANQYRLPHPEWAQNPERYPDKPWFALQSPEARIWLLTQSPTAFRERNLFISEDALSRA